MSLLDQNGSAVVPIAAACCRRRARTPKIPQHIDELLEQCLLTRGLRSAPRCRRQAHRAGQRRARADRGVRQLARRHDRAPGVRHPQRAQDRHLQHELELDTSYAIPGKSRFRMNVFRQRGTIGAVLRTIPFDIPDFDTLAHARGDPAFADLPRGLVLVTGPTGSGKSTTLAVDARHHQPHQGGAHPVVRGPDRVPLHHKKAIVNQREVGEDTQSFAAALKRALREDPDVILVGEMRDLETIHMALTAAETGHLVFATLHTQSAPQTVDRIVDVFPPDQQGQIRVDAGDDAASGGDPTAAANSRRHGPRCRGRDPDRHAGGAQPDPRAQGLPARQPDAGRRPVRHGDDGPEPRRAGPGEADHPGHRGRACLEPG